MRPLFRTPRCAMRQYSTLVWRAFAALIAFPVLCAAAAAQSVDAQKAAAGLAIYNSHCVRCHGEQLQNNGWTYDLRRLRPEDNARFVNSVLNGKGQMPPWRDALSEDEIASIWAYIRATVDH
jgi:mono/diheme cytochrome c family protein